MLINNNYYLNVYIIMVEDSLFTVLFHKNNLLHRLYIIVL